MAKRSQVAALVNIRRTLQYGLAAAIGLAWVAYAMGWATLTGSGGVFTYPSGDLPTNLAGHLALQAPGWHWPLLRAPSLAWPLGESVAMTDSNPLLTLLAKLLAGIVGHPLNLFGAWLAFCYVMQAVTAVYALRGFLRFAPSLSRLNLFAACAAAAALALLLPEYLFRINHINLLAQYLLLLALGYAVRVYGDARRPDFRATFALLAVAVLIHPYLFMFCALILATPLVAMARRRDPGTRAAVRMFGVAILLPIAFFVLLNGGLGGGARGFGLYSTNLLSAVWPQRSGVFGPGLPILDVTGFQHEGFNYLGAGTLLLLAAAGTGLLRAGSAVRSNISRRHAAMLLVLSAAAALAITPHVTLGPWVDIPLQPMLLERMFATVRASGRAIWIVDYAAMLAALAFLAARLPASFFLPLTGCVLVLQWIDTAPLRQDAVDYLAGKGQSAPAFAMPPDTTLFSAFPLCGNEDVVATEYRLLALRGNIRLGNMRLAHAPADARCAEALAAGLDALAPGETRLFMPSVEDRVQQSQAGASQCFKTAIGLLCHLPASP